MRTFLLLLCFLSFVNQETRCDNPIDVLKVQTKDGAVSGLTTGDASVKIFKGIPFAAPPVGELRWKAPVHVTPWTGVLKCEVFSASAVQNTPLPFAMWSKEFMAPVEPLGEDCLYLNLWTAAKSSDEKRPVIVWIHGGGFTGGSGSVPLYDGEEMAKKGVVFITINYRLGILGFLSLPELSKESPHHVSGNYAILDQIAALQWVRDNVAAFGGDPEKVTIAGQSAGAFSVNALVISPLAGGLFQRAIAHSGSMFMDDRFSGSDLSSMEQAGVDIMKKLNVNSLNEMRTLPADVLLKSGARTGLTIDGYVLINPMDAMKTGKLNDVPLLTGWNAGDNLSFGNPQSAESFKAEAEKRYGTDAPEFFSLFPAGTDEEAKKSQNILGMLSFGGSNYKWSMFENEFGHKPVYLYYFSRVPPGLPDYGAFHSAEFGYALKTLKFWDRPFTDYDYQLAEIMSSYWVNFASGGDPNSGKGLPEWPVFRNNTKQVMIFGDAVKPGEVPFRAQLEFLDKMREKGNKK